MRDMKAQLTRCPVFGSQKAQATAFNPELFAQYGEAVQDLEVRPATLEDACMTLVKEYEDDCASRDRRGHPGREARRHPASAVAHLSARPVQLLFFPAVTIRAVPDARPAHPRHDVLPRHQLVPACGLLHPVSAQAGSPIAPKPDEPSRPECGD